MTEWVYKVTPTKANVDDTDDIAVTQLFLCRPMNHLEKGRLVNTAFVTNVAVGDILHLYYLDGGKLRRTIGSFEVVAGRDHPRADQFVATRVGASVTVNENRLRRRRKGASTKVPGGAGSASALVALLEEAGYPRDPVDGSFVGWCLRQLDRPTPPYDRGWFP
ncbi:MAG TPA: hypothetical protein VNW92_09740, partial [Polyangiaceae bacterium]|nr:hypothetical protein [Polyangiaceae bacterium]